MAKGKKNSKTAVKRKGKLPPISSKPKTKKKTKKTPPPKKRGRPRKPRLGFSSNNFNYIRSLIWRNYKDDFKGYFDPSFITKVNEVYNECKAVGSNCSDEIILEKYLLIRTEDKRPAPVIDPELFNPQPFYQIKDIEIDTWAAYLWIVSPMILPPPSEFVVTRYFDKNGDTYKGYSKFFKEFVDWCNEVHNGNYGGSFGSDEIDIYFRFTPPAYSEAKKRWETDIVLCTATGKIHDFGFVPKGKMFDHDTEDEYVKPTKKQLQIPSSKEEAVQMEQIRVQKANKNLQEAVTDFRSKLREIYKGRKEQELRIEVQEIKNKKEKIKILESIARSQKSDIKFYKELGQKRKASKATKEWEDTRKKINEIKKSL